MRGLINLIVAAAFIIALVPAGASAQAPRTFVASTGSDLNPCSRQAPCRGFQAAVNAVAPGGEVVALDSAGYGPFTIDRSVIVSADGVHAALSIVNGTGINLNTAATDVVVLRNLTIVSTPESLNRAIDALGFIGALFVEHCTFANTSTGVNFEPASSPAEVHVTDSTFRDITGHGVAVLGAGVTAIVSDSTFEKLTGAGVLATAGGQALVRRSTVSGCAGAIGGFAAFSGSATVNVIDSVTAGNSVGVSSEGTGSTVRVSNTTITNNTTGLVTGPGATLVSMTGNHLAGNGTDGSFSSSIPAQ